MKVVITGGCGFLGRQLCSRILGLGDLIGPGDTPEPVTEIVIFDKVVALPPELEQDSKVRAVAGDISDPCTCRSLINQPGIVLFHLASVMSGQGEADFDLCLKVNLVGTQNLLEACRAQGGCRFIFASSGACFGERPEGPETDGTKLLPQTTYGMTKAVCELLLNDYSRRGFLDGRCARLPTVIPRPEVNSGLPAAFSAVIREPLKGQDVVLNVDKKLKHAVCGFRSLVRNLLHLAQLPEAALSLSSDRAMNMPCLSLCCEDLEKAVQAVAAEPSKLGKVTYEPDVTVMEKLSQFHHDMDATRALSLGMVRDSSPGALCTDFAASYLDPALLRPVVEIYEEPRHCLIFVNDAVRVFRVEFCKGETTLMHAHRVDSLYFFMTDIRVCGQLQWKEPAEDVCCAGEVRYGTHCAEPLVHRITSLSGPMFCLDVELLATGKSTSEEPPAKRLRPETALPPGLTLTKERPGARVYVLALQTGVTWTGTLTFGKMLFIVRSGTRCRGTFGERLLRPADVFYREGPLPLELHVLGARELQLWVLEVFD